jgi:TBC1 domain family member 2
MALFNRTPKKEVSNAVAGTSISVDNETSVPSSSSTATTAESVSEESSSGAMRFFSRLMGGSSPRAVPGGLRASSHSIGSMENLSSINSASSSSSSSSSGSNANQKGNDVRSNTTPIESTSVDSAAKQKKDYRTTQFEKVLDSENVDDAELRELSWRGIPTSFRPRAWQLMLGYAPTNKSRRGIAIAKKRKEYEDAIPVYFGTKECADNQSQQDMDILIQIKKDLPRTCPDQLFFHQKQVQLMMERILYIWSIRHPACGYVQGMNDVLIPLLIVAFQPHVPTSGTANMIIHSTDVLKIDIEHIATATLSHIEADAYWGFTKLLDGVQDHYTHSQPGLQRMILRLEDLMGRHCPSLNEHFANEGVQYMQFSFRWMNCFLIREVPLACVMRLWDTYFAEQRAGFETFHVNLCAVLLKTFEAQLMEMSFQEILMFLQDLPTQAWCEKDVDEMLSQAFILSTLYDGSTHLG